MSARTATRLAWGLWAVVAVIGALTLVLAGLSGGTDTPTAGDFAGSAAVPWVAASLAFQTVGALIASRLPTNAVGWVSCAAGAALGILFFAAGYTDYALFVEPGSLPGGGAARWLTGPALFPAGGLVGFLLLLFPDGRLLSSRWRPVAWLLAGAIAMGALGYALRPGPYDEPYAFLLNPLGVAELRPLMEWSVSLGWLLLALSVLLSAGALILRLRGSRGAERQRLKWIVLAAGPLGVVFFATSLLYALERVIVPWALPLLGVAFTAIPVALGIAILRYRLYDIDVVINRTLVYGVLTVTLGAVYLATVLLLQLVLHPLTAQSDLAIAGSTLAAAALFRPARARIQAVVDRRFYRRRYDAAQTLEAFGARLREGVDLDVVSGELRTVAHETMQPAHVSLWLREEADEPARPT